MVIAAIAFLVAWSFYGERSKQTDLLMQNQPERKKDLCKWISSPAPALAVAGLPMFYLASSALTSVSETELMQKRWSVGVP
ncbi:hypothetical protein D9M72_363330 [compost metagenome]